MKHNHSGLSAAIISVLGICSTIESASALTLPNGEYDLVVRTTPIFATTYGNTLYKFGTDGNWQSTFTFGGIPNPSSQGMTDTGVLVNGNGSGIAGDGYAGILRIDVNNTAFSTLSFNKDTIFQTAGGDFAQYLLNPGDYAMFTGTLNKTSGAMTLQPTGRYGAINAPALTDKRWQVDDYTTPSNTAWNIFSTSTASNNAGTINGTPLADVADVNGDGIADPQGTLVTGDQIGLDWQSFAGATFFETWRINLLARAIDDSTSVTTSSALAISVLNNDGTGATGGSKSQLTVISASTGTLGTTAVTGGGTTVTYTAGATPGADTFTYTVQDGNGVQSTATVSVNVTGNPVTVVDDGPFQANQGTTTPIAISSLTSNDSSSAGTIDDATLVPSSPTAQGGSVAVNGTDVDYDPPAPDFVGSDSFTYTVQDSASNTSDDATVSVNVAAFGQSDFGTYAPGQTAISVNSTNGLISGNDLPPYPDPNNAVATCLGGCYDYEISGFAPATVVKVVPPPLTAPISHAGLVSAPGLVMLKYFNSWQEFDTSLGDSIESTALSANGGCPSPTDVGIVWTPFNGATTTAANVGHECLRFTITDDGPNDSNKTPGIIDDPAGLSRNDTYQPTGLLNAISSTGCTISGANISFIQRLDWLLVGLFAALLGLARKKSVKP